MTRQRGGARDEVDDAGVGPTMHVSCVSRRRHAQTTRFGGVIHLHVGRGERRTLPGAPSLCSAPALTPAGVCNLFPGLCNPAWQQPVFSWRAEATPSPANPRRSPQLFPTGVLRREIICSPLPAEQLILLAAHSCCLLLHCSAAGC